MTLDNLERQKGVFNGFFGDFRLRDAFQERIVPKSIETDKEGQAANEIFSIECRFRWSKSRSRFKETCANQCTRASKSGRKSR